MALMENSINSSFAGLPVTLVKEILAKSGQIADKIYEPFQEISTSRDKLREQLQQNNIIQNDSENSDRDTLTTCGVDGYSKTEKILTSELSCAAAFAVEGLVPPSGEKHWGNPTHQSFLHTEKQFPETSRILSAVMMEMEVELAAKAPHDIIFLNGSFIVPFVTFMEIIKTALESKESKISQEFIARIKPSIISFKTIFESNNTNDTKKMWVGFPQNTMKKEFVTQLNWPQHFDEKILFTILLSPGEYTTSVPVDQTELSRIKSIPIKDEKFSAVRDSLVSAIGKLQVFYYRPHKWTTAFRIEIAPHVSENSSQLSLLLNSIQYQCNTAGITEPYPIYSAEKMAKNLEGAIPSIRKSATSYITNMYKDDLGDIFPLVMFKK